MQKRWIRIQRCTVSCYNEKNEMEMKIITNIEKWFFWISAPQTGNKQTFFHPLSLTLSSHSGCVVLHAQFLNYAFSARELSLHKWSAFDFLFIIKTFLFHLLQLHQCWFYFLIWNILTLSLNNNQKNTLPCY